MLILVRTLLILVVSMLAAACDRGGSDAAVCSGERLFGRPGAQTGLDDARCGPTCSCGGKTWTAKAYTAADADALLAWQLATPLAELTSDPYEQPAPAPPPPDEVCAVVTDAPGARVYRLESFPSEADARATGAQPTHFGACGLCSTLADLAVYMRYPDLTAPVRQCGMDHINGPPEAHIACLQQLGFTLPCAQIWYYNTRHTLFSCARPCFALAGEPYHTDDAGLNECLACDEVESGAWFKAVAGRTRRNTGIASAMCRPCREVRPLEHDYP
jgi:hypothetical protein